MQPLVPASPVAVGRPKPEDPPGVDPVGLSWLVTVRWTTLLASAGALVAGRSSLGAESAIALPILGLLFAAASNLWLMWRTRRRAPTGRLVRAAGLFICLDVALLSWLLHLSGGVLNPASVLYLVQIVVAALVLGPWWTGVVTALTVAGYAVLFLAPTDELSVAQAMHPEIGLHMRGMWIAFAATALVIGVLVSRLAVAVSRRDRALEAFRDREARTSRFTGLATLAAGAAHELRTPLSTMVVAAAELERSLSTGGHSAGLVGDARLIRTELDRCSRLIDDMAGRIAEPAGEDLRRTTAAVVLAEAVDRLPAAERRRVRLDVATDPAVVWPVGVVAQAVANLVQNGLQASPDGPMVQLAVGRRDDHVEIAVVDQGQGMTPAEVTRAGEPFFTTKPAGTGLGLFVAQSAIEQLGGTLTLHSAAGRGTRATIVLPADVVRRGAR